MIRFENVSFSYDNASRALDGVTLDIAEGSYVCVLGGNGSGKSTLAKHMNALLLPDEGTVRTADYNTADAREVYNIRQTAGMMFQNPDDQLVASLVEDDVAFGPENLGVETAELAERVRDALREVGLVGFEKHSTGELSGGQKQRVAIAGVLAMQPRVLVLDEASAMLDPRGRAGLRRVCRNLHERGLTIVAITHFMEEAADADRVVVLDGGRVVLDGAPADVLVQSDVLARLNLEVPFSAACSHELARAGLPITPCIGEDELAQQILHCCEGAIRTGEATSGAAEDAEGEATPASANGSPAPASAPTSEAAPAGEPAAPANAPDSATRSPAAEALIAFEHVSFTYDVDREKRQRKRKRRGNAGDEPAERADWGNSPDAAWTLRDVSFSVHAGEFFGIAGHTGSGKSTLVQHMNGILHPTEGRVLVRGRDLAAKAGAAAARQTVGMVFQYPEHQLFADTVYNDVAFGPRNLGLAEDEVERRVHDALRRVGLDPNAVCAKSPFELSGGQQRRVAFAGVLSMNPDVLVLDEPAAGLDPAARRSFLALIKGLNAGGLTVVMVSHNMDDLAALCDRIAVLNEGRLVALDAPQQVFLHADELRSVGLGVPAPQQLANRLRKAGLPLSAEVLYTAESLARALTALACKSGEAVPARAAAPAPNAPAAPEDGDQR